MGALFPIELNWFQDVGLDFVQYEFLMDKTRSFSSIQFCCIDFTSKMVFVFLQMRHHWYFAWNGSHSSARRSSYNTGPCRYYWKSEERGWPSEMAKPNCSQWEGPLWYGKTTHCRQLRGASFKPGFLNIIRLSRTSSDNNLAQPSRILLCFTSLLWLYRIIERIDEEDDCHFCHQICWALLLDLRFYWTLVALIEIIQLIEVLNTAKVFNQQFSSYGIMFLMYLKHSVLVFSVKPGGLLKLYFVRVEIWILVSHLGIF